MYLVYKLDALQLLKKITISNIFHFEHTKKFKKETKNSAINTIRLIIL